MKANAARPRRLADRPEAAGGLGSSPNRRPSPVAAGAPISLGARNVICALAG